MKNPLNLLRLHSEGLGRWTALLLLISNKLLVVENLGLFFLLGDELDVRSMGLYDLIDVVGGNIGFFLIKVRSYHELHIGRDTLK